MHAGAFGIVLRLTWNGNDDSDVDQLLTGLAVLGLRLRLGLSGVFLGHPFFSCRDRVLTLVDVCLYLERDFLRWAQGGA